MSTIKAGKIQPPNDSDSLQIFTNTVQRMTVTSGGLVGIGTVTPTAKLQTIDTYNAARFGANNINSLTIGSHGGSPYSGIGYNVNFDSGADNQYFALAGDRTSLIRFHNGGFQFKGNATNGAISGTPFALTEYMTILNSGLVGIGTSYPAYKLVVGANNGNALEFGPEFAEGNNLLQSYNRTTSVYTKLTSTALSHAICVGTSGTEKVTIDSSGRVGIGTTTPAVALHVVGSIKASTSLILGDVNATMAVPNGSAPIFGARAWAYIPSSTVSGTQPASSGNIASITRFVVNGLEKLTKVTFITPMPHANYAVVGMARLADGFANQPLVLISPGYVSGTAIQPNTTTEMYYTVWDNSTDSIGYNHRSDVSLVIYC